MEQLGQAVEYILSKGYVHNRNNPDSVMIRSAHQVVLSHFLCVTSFPDRKANLERPKLVPDLPLDWDAKKNDIWGYNVTFAFAISGSDLFNEPGLGLIATSTSTILKHFSDHFKVGIENNKRNHKRQLDIKSEFHAFLKSEYLSNLTQV